MNDYAANLALFLTEKTGTPLGTWKGRMPAKKQRAMFGMPLGSDPIVINGNAETIESPTRALTFKWSELRTFLTTPWENPPGWGSVCKCCGLRLGSFGGNYCHTDCWKQGPIEHLAFVQSQRIERSAA